MPRHNQKSDHPWRKFKIAFKPKDIRAADGHVSDTYIDNLVRKKTGKRAYKFPGKEKSI